MAEAGALEERDGSICDDCEHVWGCYVPAAAGRKELFSPRLREGSRGVGYELVRPRVREAAAPALQRLP